VGRRRCLACLAGLGGAVLAGTLARPARATPSESAAAAAGSRSGGASSPGPLNRASSAPSLGSPVSLPAITLLDGRQLPASHWQGKVVVVELWASWCPFCARQNPHLDALHRKHRLDGLEVLALSIDRHPDTARRYLGEHGYVFHAAMFDDRWRAVLGQPKGLPIIWVIDREGRLAKLEIGELFPEDIEEFALLL
jgi:thiol-disulfide isomerase/thioredoxin